MRNNNLILLTIFCEGQDSHYYTSLFLRKKKKRMLRLAGCDLPKATRSGRGDQVSRLSDSNSSATSLLYVSSSCLTASLDTALRARAGGLLLATFTPGCLTFWGLCSEIRVCAGCRQTLRTMALHRPKEVPGPQPPKHLVFNEHFQRAS